MVWGTIPRPELKLYALSPLSPGARRAPGRSVVLLSHIRKKLLSPRIFSPIPGVLLIPTLFPEPGGPAGPPGRSVVLFKK